ncbi:MAG TPA: diacylglycerol kinase family protein [Acidimicrobiales bacterium]|nr:diacylglycerol kinase family protein [Acidimicrobiales bacterium]
MSDAEGAQGRRARVRLVVNPAASAVTDKSRRAVHEALVGHEVEEVETEKRDDATHLAREAADAGVDAVVVLGGDGTANEAANGLLGTDTALAALPGGSTNVFVRTLGLSHKPARAAAQIAEGLARSSLRRIPVGVANDRAFLFHVGIGFDAAVVAQVERHSALKRRIGQAIFVYAAFATWLRHYDTHDPAFALEFEDGSTVEDGYFSIVLNTNPYTYLGPRPLNVAPGATGENGLATVTLRTLKVGALLGVTSRALGKGNGVAEHPRVDHRRDQARVTVRGHRPVPWQVDGDYLGDTEHIVLTPSPHRLPVVVPGG